ncbi:probable endochitinase [Ochlerotatus camptorhynchus]|uniref:probable endochitinase n=1 Tax=Ochlerotatus camptorhynchus TaxID=644619 RepID=UPI0031DBAEE0
MSKILLLICLVGYVAAGEIVVDSRALLALKKRSDIDLFSLRWCDIFYQEDFPTNSVCSGKEDGVWDYFPSCCNGAYNCRFGSIWNVYLCPAGFIFNAAKEVCEDFTENTCPYLEDGTGEDDMSTTESTTTQEPVVNCNIVVNGRIPHPSNCTKFINCINGSAYVRDCLEGYIYYAPFAVCLPGLKETCKLHSIDDLD